MATSMGREGCPSGAASPLPVVLERPNAEPPMIGILSVLFLAVPQGATAPSAGAANASAPIASFAEAAPRSACAADRSAATAILAELERLSVVRQQSSAEAPWSRVQALVDGLPVSLVASSTSGLAEGMSGAQRVGAAEVARVFTELAIGATPSQRLSLVRACQEVLSLEVFLGARSELLGAQVLILEPLIASVADGDKRPAALRASALYEDLVLKVTDPGTGEAPVFLRRSRLRLERLRLGAPMPRFVARDSAGNELRSAQLEGEVLVLRFWDHSSAASLAAHRADGTWVREFWDAPFDLLGVSRSKDRGSYLRQLEAAAFSGVQLFDGPISDALAEALDGHEWGAPGAFGATGEHGAGLSLSNRWVTPPPGSLFVVDARGRIRGRALPPAATRSLVRQLIVEERVRRRKQIVEGARSR